jgi:glycerophosphoryl diester phosphodiesterase
MTLKKIKIIAHRGFSSIYPENTLLSFEKAYSLGARTIEFDITLTLDKEIVLIHDDTLDRTTNGLGRVRKLNFSDIKKLDASSWKNPKFKTERIPSLEEVLIWAKSKKDLVLNIEIKSSAYTKTAFIEKQTLLFLEKHKLENRVFISSFNQNILQNLRQNSKTIKLSALPLAKDLDSQKIKGFLKLNLYSMNLSKNYFIEKNLPLLNSLSKKIKLYVYTVNTIQDFKNLPKFISGIFTDSPDIFLGSKIEI